MAVDSAAFDMNGGDYAPKPTVASANVLGSMLPSMTGQDAVRARLRISARARAELRHRHDCDQANAHPFGMSSIGPAYPKNLTTALFVAIVVALVA
jgi:hypothetical protein